MRSSDLWVQFAEWHEANPHVWLLFVRFTREAILSGRKHYSARDIIHRIRWHTNVELRSTDEFKINNNLSPYYARIFIACFPQHGRLFELREAEVNDTVRDALVERMRAEAQRGLT